jgi:hypothetical protein
MSISSISSNSNNYLTGSAQNKFSQFQTDFQQLGSALQSGDLSTAQGAFSALQNLLTNASAATRSQQSQNGQSTLSTDLNTLGQALQSGNLSNAQAAHTKVQQDMQTVQASHRSGHHHHQHADASQDSSSASSSTSGISGETTGGSPTGSKVNLTT